MINPKNPLSREQLKQAQREVMRRFLEQMKQDRVQPLILVGAQAQGDCIGRAFVYSASMSNMDTLTMLEEVARKLRAKMEGRCDCEACRASRN